MKKLCGKRGETLPQGSVELRKVRSGLLQTLEENGKVMGTQHGPGDSWEWPNSNAPNTGLNRQGWDPKTTKTGGKEGFGEHNGVHS